MSKIIKIKVPATTANFGCGFDFFGIALNLYNEFQFELINNKDYVTIGFDDIENNLVLDSFKKIVNKYNRSDIKVKITILKNDVPFARGLGSSATAIVSGCVAANYFMDNSLSEEQLINEMVEIEGHPDNILACFYGGAISSIKDDKLYVFHHNINKDLLFNVLIPSYTVKTKDARDVLPKNYFLNDITYNASRAMVLSESLEKGDMKLIKLATKDCIHEPYRKKFIKEYDLIENSINNLDAKLIISGSGPTMILLAKDNKIIDKLKDLKLNIKIYSLKVSDIGCEINIL